MHQHIDKWKPLSGYIPVRVMRGGKRHDSVERVPIPVEGQNDWYVVYHSRMYLLRGNADDGHFINVE